MTFGCLLRFFCSPKILLSSIMHEQRQRFLLQASAFFTVCFTFYEHSIPKAVNIICNGCQLQRNTTYLIFAVLFLFVCPTKTMIGSGVPDPLIQSLLSPSLFHSPSTFHPCRSKHEEILRHLVSKERSIPGFDFVNSYGQRPMLRFSFKWKIILIVFYFHYLKESWLCFDKVLWLRII